MKKLFNIISLTLTFVIISFQSTSQSESSRFMHPKFSLFANAGLCVNFEDNLNINLEYKIFEVKQEWLQIRPRIGFGFNDLSTRSYYHSSKGILFGSSFLLGYRKHHFELSTNGFIGKKYNMADTEYLQPYELEELGNPFIIPLIEAGYRFQGEHFMARIHWQNIVGIGAGIGICF